MKLLPCIVLIFVSWALEWRGGGGGHLHCPRFCAILSTATNPVIFFLFRNAIDAYIQFVCEIGTNQSPSILCHKVKRYSTQKGFKAANQHIFITHCKIVVV